MPLGELHIDDFGSVARCFRLRLSRRKGEGHDVRGDRRVQRGTRHRPLSGRPAGGLGRSARGRRRRQRVLRRHRRPGPPPGRRRPGPAPAGQAGGPQRRGAPRQHLSPRLPRRRHAAHGPRPAIVWRRRWTTVSRANGLRSRRLRGARSTRRGARSSSATTTASSGSTRPTGTRCSGAAWSCSPNAVVRGSTSSRRSSPTTSSWTPSSAPTRRSSSPDVVSVVGAPSSTRVLLRRLARVRRGNRELRASAPTGAAARPAEGLGWLLEAVRRDPRLARPPR